MQTLTGIDLDFAVGQILNLNPSIEGGLVFIHVEGEKTPFSPSTLWSQGGPLIESERIELFPDNKKWEASCRADTSLYGMIYASGKTPLEAAMRLILLKKSKK